MTGIETNGPAMMVIAAQQLRIAVNQGNISETVTIAGEIEQMANDLCIYLTRLAEELTRTGQSLPLGWSEWLQEKRNGL